MTNHYSFLIFQSQSFGLTMLLFLVLKFQAGHGIISVVYRYKSYERFLFLFEISKLIILDFLNASMLVFLVLKFQAGNGIFSNLKFQSQSF